MLLLIYLLNYKLKRFEGKLLFKNKKSRHPKGTGFFKNNLE